MVWFPPFFPESRYLNKQPWHKIIWILSAIFSICSLYSALVVLLVFFKIYLLVPGILSWLMVLPSLPLLWMIHSRASSLTATSNSPLSNLYSQSPQLVTVLQSPSSGLWLLAIYYLILIFIPSILYRLMLNQLLGKRWKGS